MTNTPNTPSNTTPIASPNGSVTPSWYTFFQYIGRAIPQVSQSILDALKAGSLQAAFTALAANGGTIGDPLTLTSPLSVPNGGTGRGSLNSNALLVGNGNTTVKFLPPTAKGALVTSNGNAWESVAPPLIVAYGGTGRATLTSHNVIVGAGTNPVNSVAPGASGNLLTSDGTDWTSAAPPAPYVQPTTFGDVGTYAVSPTSNQVVVGNADYAGTDVGFLGGTWRCMGVLVQYDPGPPSGAMALYLRIS